MDQREVVCEFIGESGCSQLFGIRQEQVPVEHDWRCPVRTRSKWGLSRGDNVGSSLFDDSEAVEFQLTDDYGLPAPGASVMMNLRLGSVQEF
jgi:hypothetical protein